MSKCRDCHLFGISYQQCQPFKAGILSIVSPCWECGAQYLTGQSVSHRTAASWKMLPAACLSCLPYEAGTIRQPGIDDEEDVMCPHHQDKHIPPAGLKHR